MTAASNLRSADGRRRVEVFRPDSDGHWKLYDMRDDEAVVLDSVGARISLAELFSRPGDDRPGAG